jgi:hypothetical protein
MSHTPGPWRVHSEVPNRIILNGSACYEVVDPISESSPCNHADMRLIAAAPEMLVVLRRVIDMANCAMEYVGVDDAHTLKRALERVSKAKRECERVIALAEGRE